MARAIWFYAPFRLQDRALLMYLRAADINPAGHGRAGGPEREIVEQSFNRLRRRLRLDGDGGSGTGTDASIL